MGPFSVWYLVSKQKKKSGIIQLNYCFENIWSTLWPLKHSHFVLWRKRNGLKWFRFTWRMRYYDFIRPLPKLTKRHSSLPHDDENDIIRRSLVLCFSTHLFSESCTCFHAGDFHVCTSECNCRCLQVLWVGGALACCCKSLPSVSVRVCESLRVGVYDNAPVLAMFSRTCTYVCVFVDASAA